MLIFVLGFAAGIASMLVVNWIGDFVLDKYFGDRG